MLNQKRRLRVEPSYILLLLTPFLSMLVLCLLFGTSPFAIDLVAMDWNDEIGYYKAAQTMLEFGAPQGCTGYNESLGSHLSYDAWIPTIFVPYAVFGRIFGWQPIGVMLCNVSLTVAANAGFLALVRPRRSQCLWLCLFSGLYLTYERYVWSNMSEALFTSFLILSLGLIWWLAEHGAEKSRRFLLALGGYCVLVGFYATMRPYYLALFGLPVLLALKERRPAPAIWAVVCGGISGAVYLYLNANYCSPYMEENVMVDLPTTLSGWPGFILRKNLEALDAMVGYAREGGIQAVVTFFFLAQLALLAFWWLTHIGQSAVSWLLFGYGVVFAAIYEAMALFYLTLQNHRHLLGACVLMGYLFCLVLPVSCRIFQQALAAFLSLAILGDGISWLALPQRDELSSQRADTLPAAFEEVMELAPVTDPWANTVAYDLSAPYQPLYFLPAGMAISYCRSDYLEQAVEEETLKSKYLYVKPESGTSELCREKGWELVMQAEGFVLYENPNYEADALA